MKKIVKIKSSSFAETYDVTLSNENGKISLNCTCQAGVHSMICKHRITLLNGDVSNVSKKSDIQVVEEFLNSIEVGKIDSLFAELIGIEKEIEKLNKTKSKLKRAIGFSLSKGF